MLKVKRNAFLLITLFCSRIPMKIFLYFYRGMDLRAPIHLINL